ncbi:MAG: hypothetical protein JO346_11755 [Alphaproteobacteria bacterium]|nr:hypothetical protein [Alphaproteobacteria bacterium]
MRIAVCLAGLLLTLGVAHAAAPGWSTYTDAKRGFTIDYPSDWKVNPNFVDKGYRFFQGDNEATREGVAFSPTTDIAPGTTLQSDQLMLVVQRARPGDMCLAKAFLVDPSPDNVTRTLLDKPEAIQTVADAGDLYTIEHIAILASSKPCIAVHYIIVNARPHAPLKPVNHDALVQFLGKMSETLKPL